MTYLIEARENESSMKLVIHKPTPRYFNELLGLKCGPDLLISGVFPNAKEVTESFSCFRASTSALGGMPSCGFTNVTAFVVGDGSTPRTGAVLAMRSRWKVYSIDPLLRSTWIGTNPLIKKLIGICDKAENVPPIDCNGGAALIVLCHSHAPLTAALNVPKNYKTLSLVSMPCCVALPLTNLPKPDAEYNDWGVWSEKRRMYIWRNLA